MLAEVPGDTVRNLPHLVAAVPRLNLILYIENTEAAFRAINLNSGRTEIL